MPLDVSLCRCAIRVASLLAPAGFRAEWVREWNTEIWHGYASLISRGGSRSKARRKLLRFAAGAFSDVADLRRSVFNLEAALGRPGFCCALPLLVLSVVFVASHGFRYCREMIAGTPVPQPQEPAVVVTVGEGFGDRGGAYARGFACLAARRWAGCSCRV